MRERKQNRGFPEGENLGKGRRTRTADDQVGMLHVGIDSIEEAADSDIRHIAHASGDGVHVLHAHLPHDAHVVTGGNPLDAFFDFRIDAGSTLRTTYDEHGFLAFRKFGRTGKRIAIGQLAHRVSEHHAPSRGEELRRIFGSHENSLSITGTELVRNAGNRILFLQVDGNAERTRGKHNRERNVTAGSDDHIGVHLLHDALRAHQRLRKLEGKRQVLEERPAVQRFGRDVFIGPVASHQAFFHRILTAGKRNVRHAHFLEALGNSYCREDVATGATAYKQELFHVSVLAISNPPNV